MSFVTNPFSEYRFGNASTTIPPRLHGIEQVVQRRRRPGEMLGHVPAHHRIEARHWPAVGLNVTQNLLVQVCIASQLVLREVYAGESLS